MFSFMKLLFCLLWFGVSWADYELSPIAHSDCPTIDDVNHAVMLPYPQDCTKYYSCLNGYAHLQQCPNNLHWSTLTYRCEYPDKAKCQATVPIVPIAPIEPITPATPDLTASSTGEILYQLHANDCSKYYKCQAMSCPTFYYWNSLTQKCDFPHNAHCPFTSGMIGATDFESVPIVAEIFTQLYPQDCTKYYQCQTMLCPNNYHWNIRLQQCDLPQLAQCPFQPLQPAIVETSTFAVPTAFTAPPTPPMTVQPNVVTEDSTVSCIDCVQRCDGFLHHYLPHPNDCHKFIQCNGWSFIHTCPDNLFWNAKLNTCDRVCVAI